MKPKTKVIIIVAVIVALLVGALIIYWESTHGNRRLIDTSYRFDRAIIQLPNGQVIDGKVSSWLDFDDSDANLYKKGNTIISHWSETKVICENLPIDRKYPYKSGVNIMFGCNNFCTYCIVPYVRGRERSREADEIIKEIENLVKDGVIEIMLLGQNVNSYGKNLDNPITFAELLRRVEKIEGLERIRFMTSHPKDLSDELIEVIKNSKKICHHIHLPLQSGSSRILKKMNRVYDKEKYLDLALKIRREIPDISITTDIIVGFPGETEEDFQKTLDAVEKAKFDAAFTFQYSPRPGTKAASFDNQIPQDVVTERFGRLMEYTNRYAEESNGRLVGKTMEVLIEGISKAGDMTFSGRTITNHLVNFTIPEELGIDIGPDYLEGRLCEVRIDHARPYSVDGVLVSLKGE